MSDESHRQTAHHARHQPESQLGPLAAGGLALALLFALTYTAGGYLGWYPSRLGAPAAWVEDHLLALARPLLFGPAGRRTLEAGAAYLAALLGAFAVYALALRRAARVERADHRHLALALGFAGAFAIILLFQPYLASQDVFSYAFYARILVAYGRNPYVDVPRDFPFDPLFGAIFWRDQPSNYGPLWTYLSALVALGAGSSVPLLLAGQKALVTAFALLGVPLVWAILGRLAPREQALGTFLFAWNPLLVVETAGNGHNDAVMAAFLLLAVWLHLRARPTLVVAALTAAALTKYVAAALLPLYVVLLLREAAGWRPRAALLGRAGLVALGLGVAAFLPFYRGPATFQVVSFGSNPLAYTNSPLELAFRELRVALGEARDLADLPLRYRGRWVETQVPTVFWSAVDDPAAQGVSLPVGTPLLIVAPPRSHWQHLYAPRLDRFGYAPVEALAPAPPPASAGPAGATAAALGDASRSPAAQRANLIVRTAATLVFAAAYALALRRRTGTLREVVAGSLALLLLSYWLVETWFWPWYVVWSLGYAALLPRSRLALLTLAFCLTALLLNAQADVEMGPALAAAYEYRSAAIFGLPLLAAGAVLALRGERTHRRAARPPSPPRLARATSGAARWLAGLALAASLAAILGLLVAGAAPGARAELTPSQAQAAWEVEQQVGLEHLRAQRYARAAAALTRAAAYQPDRPETRRARFVAYLQTGRYDEAVADLDWLLAVEGERLELLLARGEAQARRQRLDLARRDFARAAALDPLEPRPRRQRALAYFQAGQLGAALRELHAALARAPGSAAVYRELGDAYASRGEYAAALAAYDRAIALAPENVQGYASRAALRHLLGQPGEGVPDLTRVLVLSDDLDERLWAERTLLALASAWRSEEEERSGEPAAGPWGER